MHTHIWVLYTHAESNEQRILLLKMIWRKSLYLGWTKKAEDLHSRNIILSHPIPSHHHSNLKRFSRTKLRKLSSKSFSFCFGAMTNLINKSLTRTHWASCTKQNTTTPCIDLGSDSMHQRGRYSLYLQSGISPVWRRKIHGLHWGHVAKQLTPDCGLNLLHPRTNV